MDGAFTVASQSDRSRLSGGVLRSCVCVCVIHLATIRE